MATVAIVMWCIVGVLAVVFGIAAFIRAGQGPRDPADDLPDAPNRLRPHGVPWTRD